MNKAAGAGGAQFFIPLAKIDQAKHQVWGYAAVEEGDIADEIMDYATSLPHFKKWSADARTRSGGKSLGNLRSMHQSLAAGRLIDFQPNDQHKGIWIGAEVVDPDEWAKVEKGVYTGFSIGGDYAARWYDPRVMKTRYTAKPIEISLVDAPCIPSATFQVVKADQSIELRKFAPTNGLNMLKAEMPSSPSAAGTQDLGPVNWKDVSVDRMPDPDLMMQVSPANPPSGETLASRHRGVQELGTQIEELLDAAGIGPALKKAILEQAEGMLKAAGWDESKHHRDHGKFSATEGASRGEQPKAESGGAAYSDADAPDWKKETVKPPTPAGADQQPVGEGWVQSADRSSVTHQKSSGGKFNDDLTAYVTHPKEPGGQYRVSTYDRTAGSQEPGAPVKNEVTMHPTREAAYAHAEAHLAGGAKPAGKPLMTPDQIAADKAELAAADTPEKKKAWAGGAPAGEQGSKKSNLPPGHESMSDDQFMEAYAAHNGITLAPKNQRGPAKAYRARMMALENGADSAGATRAGNNALAPKAEQAPEAGNPEVKPGYPMSGQAMEADKAHSKAAKTPEERNVWAYGPKAVLKGREEDDPSITAAEHKAIAMHHHYMAQGTGDPTGEHKAKEQAHEAAAAKKSPTSLQPISAEQRAQQEQDGMTFSTAGKPKGEHPGKALAEKWKDEPDAKEITPDEHYKMADYHAQNGDTDSAWQQAIQGASKTNGHRQLPDVLMTASHEHYQKTGKPLPEPDKDSGAHILRSSRIRGKGGMVGYHPKTGNWGAAYQSNDPITGETRWTTETGTALKNNSGELAAHREHHTSQAAAHMHLAQHVEGGVKKAAIPIRRPLPALAKRGAMPLEKAQRLVKVTTQTNPRQPATGEPRKIKVKP